MLEPIPFLGWFNWFEDIKPLNNEKIFEIARNELIGWACDEDLISFVKAIEEHHGIK